MKRWPSIALVAVLATTGSLLAGEISGKYVEARSTDVWTGPCFANADMNLGGRQAVLAWKVEKGTLDGARLDGLGVVAVVVTSDTLGLEQSGPAKAVIIVDDRADEAQRKALIKLAREQGGKLVDNVIAIRSESVDLDIRQCDGGGCARLKAGKATLSTRCLDHKDTVCGNESAFYPPLTRGVKVSPAMATEFGYVGKELDQTWKESGRRGAYIGAFTAN
jgi:hypothetical protein